MIAGMGLCQFPNKRDNSLFDPVVGSPTGAYFGVSAAQ